MAIAIHVGFSRRAFLVRNIGSEKILRHGEWFGGDDQVRVGGARLSKKKPLDRTSSSPRGLFFRKSISTRDGYKGGDRVISENELFPLSTVAKLPNRTSQ